MSRWAYVGGRWTRHADARVHVEDRGFQFADGVYEVWAVFDGRLADSEGHFTRLERSLGELRIGLPMSRAALARVLAEAVRRNRVRDGIVYLQVTRGQARRDHVFPTADTRPTVVVTARPLDLAAGEAKAAAGVAVITVPESRWARCDIKSVALLPNVLAKQAAREAGAYEAWFVDDEGVLRTRDTAANILRGVTRAGVLDLVPELQLRVEQRPFTVAEAKGAREAFVTAASALVMPVVRIDGAPVDDGRPGPVATAIRRLYLDRARAARPALRPAAAVARLCVSGA